MTINFDIKKAEFEIISDILKKNLPADYKIWVFGSRTKNKAGFNSDLDLAIEGNTKVPSQIMRQLKEDFTQSKLPYTVDILDMNDIEDNFKNIIDGQKVLFL